MIEAREVLQEVQDAAAATAFKIPPRPCSRPFDVDDKAAAGSDSAIRPGDAWRARPGSEVPPAARVGASPRPGSGERLGWGSPGGTDLTRPSSVYTSLGESPAP